MPFDQFVQMFRKILEPALPASCIRYSGGARNPLVGVGAFDRLQTAHDCMAGQATPTAHDRACLLATHGNKI